MLFVLFSYCCLSSSSSFLSSFLSLSLSELRTFQKMGLRPTLYLKDGTNFSDFHVADKFVVREKLNLPLDGKIMLFVGNFTRVRGINKILN